MKAIKLPRKLKKELKKAMIAKFPAWKSNEIGICGVSTKSKNTRCVRYKGVAVTASRLIPNQITNR